MVASSQGFDHVLQDKDYVPSDEMDEKQFCRTLHLYMMHFKMHGQIQ